MNEELENQIFGIRRQSSGCLRDKDFEGVIKYALKAWEMIPEPKKQYSESFLVSRMVCEGAIGLKDEKLSEKWTEIYSTSALHRIDSGERDFMNGRHCFVFGKFDEAKAHFTVADKKSKGRVWEGEDPSYFMLFKKK